VHPSDNEPVTFTRDVDAIIVPAGMNVKLRQGQQGFITQALGGSFTVYVEGNLFRVAGKDADALGKEAADVPQLPPNASNDDVRELAWQQMKTCYDPEIPINIVDLGLVYSCDVHMDENGDRITDVSFQGSGCAISVASASLLTESVKGHTVPEAEQLFTRMHELLTRDDAATDPVALGKLAALSGVREFPARVKCASLCWHTLDAALHREAEPVSTE
jgi:SUF system NifU family Fe-S assembly protein